MSLGVRQNNAPVNVSFLLRLWHNMIEYTLLKMHDECDSMSFVFPKSMIGGWNTLFMP